VIVTTPIIPGKRRKRPQRRHRLLELFESVGVALVLFILLRTFGVQAFRIPSSSMEDTLLIGDFLFITKFEYGARVPFTDYRLPGFREPQHGDIIVFQFPGEEDNEQTGLDYIKRCIAVSGQTVEMINKELFVDGVLQLEPYVRHKSDRINRIRDNFGPLVVPEGHLFMMGDNRDNSYDSRSWGALPIERVRGRAFIRYFSWEDDGLLWKRIARKKVRWTRLMSPIE
jgi:signal peptidase I